MLRGDLYKLLSLSDREGGYCAAVTLNADCSIYAAHFPGMPITPGVCIIQMCVELASEICGRSLAMTGAKDIRFLVPLVPIGGPLEIDISPVAFGLMEFVVKAGDTIHAKLKLTLE